MVLRLTSRSPRRPGFVATVICASSRRLDANPGASEPHDFAVRQQTAFVSRAAASTASRPAFVTCARPSVGQDSDRYRSDLGSLASEISEFQKIPREAFSSSSPQTRAAYEHQILNDLADAEKKVAQLSQDLI